MHTVITVDDLNHEIQQLHAKARDLTVQIEVLEGLRKRVLSRKPSAPSKPKASRSNGQAGLTIAESVRRYVLKHPFKHTQGEIVQTLKDQINTKATNPERSLYSTLWTLKGSGFLRLDRKKRVGPVVLASEVFAPEAYDNDP